MYNIKHAVKMLAFISITVLVFIFLPVSCFAWNAIGVHENASGQTICPVTPDTVVDLTADDFSVSGCTFSVGYGNQVPRSDNYHVVLSLIDSKGNYNNAITSSDNYITAGVDISDALLSFAVKSQLKLGSNYVHICYMLGDNRGDYYVFNNTPQSCPASGGVTPLPSPFQCTFGDGNTLNVSLGDVDRTEIGAVPGTLPGTEKSINITCTGDGTATYTISFQYTAVDIAGTEMISSTANGLAVAMSLNDELVNPTDTYSRTYSTGTQTEKLTFEPVRDPSVKIGDIPTGAFSASAVMILTAQ